MPFRRRSTRRLLLTLAVCAVMLALVSCAPQGGDGKEPARDSKSASTVDFTWTATSDCGSCHENDARSFEDPGCVASKHASMKEDCLTCHEDQAGLEKAHAKVTLESEKKKAKLKKTEVSETVCLNCHDKEELAAATAGSSVLTDSNGTVVNPHSIPANDDHVKANIACASCHKVHAAESSAEIAPGVCANCHHHDVYECGTCHT